MFNFLTKRIAALFILLSLGVASTPFHVVYATGFATETTQLADLAEQTWGTIQQTITAGASTLIAGLTGQLQLKEYVLDPIAWAAAKLIITNMTNSLIEWVNSGFEGRPSFVVELDKFLLEQIDATAGAFLEQLAPGLAELVCDPFGLDLQIALSLNYQRTTLNRPQAQCTISGIVNNLESFLAGNYIDGGLPGLVEISRNSANTPFGAYLQAQIDFDRAVSQRRSAEIKLAEFGEGMLSQRQCDDSGNNCRVVTPGQLIEEATTFQLSTGPRSLLEADEFNELFAELLAALFNQALLGVGGLLGLTESSYTSPAIRQAGTQFLGQGGSEGETFDTGTDGTGLDDAVDANNDELATNPDDIREELLNWLEIQNDAAEATEEFVEAYENESDKTDTMDIVLSQATDMAARASDASATITDLLNQLNIAEGLDGAARDDAIQLVVARYGASISTFVTQGEVNSVRSSISRLF